MSSIHLVLCFTFLLLTLFFFLPPFSSTSSTCVCASIKYFVVSLKKRRFSSETSHITSFAECQRRKLAWRKIKQGERDKGARRAIAVRESWTVNYLEKKLYAVNKSSLYKSWDSMKNNCLCLLSKDIICFYMEWMIKIESVFRSKVIIREIFVYLRAEQHVACYR